MSDGVLSETFRRKRAASEMLGSAQVRGRVCRSLYRSAPRVTRCTGRKDGGLGSFRDLVTSVFRSVCKLGPGCVSRDGLSTVTGRFGGDVLRSLVTSSGCSTMGDMYRNGRLPTVKTARRFAGSLLRSLDDVLGGTASNGKRMGNLSVVRGSGRTLVRVLSKLTRRLGIVPPRRRPPVRGRTIRATGGVTRGRRRLRGFSGVIRGKLERGDKGVGRFITGTIGSTGRHTARVRAAIVT